MMRLVVNENIADKRFVHYWLMGAPSRDYISRNAKGTSPSMKKISQGVVTRIPFPISLSIREQHSIVAYLDSLQARAGMLHRMQYEAAAELDALLPSVLDKAFKGSL
jgi:type I restriction enzyme S subunit